MSNTNVTVTDKKKKAKAKKKDIVISVLIIGIALGGTFGVFAILKAALKTEIPMVVVISDSMVPVIYKGDLLIVKGMDPADIKEGTAENKEGDIIIYNASGLGFYDGNEPIVHRVIGKYQDPVDGKWYFITKGDHNTYPDNNGKAFSEDRIMGVVTKIVPDLGWPKIWLSEKNTGTYVIVILGIMLIVSIVWDIVHPEEDEEEKDEKKKALDAIKKAKENKSEELQDQQKPQGSSDSSVNMGI